MQQIIRRKIIKQQIIKQQIIRRPSTGRLSPARATTLAALGALALMPVLAPTAARAQAGFQPVMTGLDSPYGLAVSPDGGLYVAEAGTGNNSAAGAPGFVSGAGTPVYFGDTGAVSRLQNGIQTRVISGLPSLGPVGGSETTGLQGIAFDAGGQLYGAFGLGGTEAQRTQLVSDVLGTTGAGTTNAGDLGQLVRLNTGSNTVTPLSDLVPYETQNYAKNNPDMSVPEANPFGLAALPGGGFAISDGGGNVVLQAPAGGGTPSLLSALPAAPNTTGRGGPTYQSVPTALALDAKGSLYAGEFTGYPFPAGGASVLRLDPSTGKSFTFAGGFTTITGLTFGPNGDMYVLDETTNGLGPAAGAAQLFQVDPSGVHTLLASLPGGIDYTSLIAGPGNALYISSQGVMNSQGTFEGSGQVLRYSLNSPSPRPPRRSLSACCWPWAWAGWWSPRGARRGAGRQTPDSMRLHSKTNGAGEWSHRAFCRALILVTSPYSRDLSLSRASASAIGWCRGLSGSGGRRPV